MTIERTDIEHKRVPCPLIQGSIALLGQLSDSPQLQTLSLTIPAVTMNKAGFENPSLGL